MNVKKISNKLLVCIVIFTLVFGGLFYNSPVYAGEASCDWGRASLQFVGGVEANCKQISATIKNSGSGDMKESVKWYVYWLPLDGKGNPINNGELIETFTLDPLKSGETKKLTYNVQSNPNGPEGKYQIKADRETGHPGGGSGLKSDEMIVQSCQPDEEEPPKEDPPKEEPPAEHEKLRLTSVCSDDPEVTRKWRVTNTNSEAFYFTWKLYGTEHESAEPIKVEAGGTVYFETPTVGGANTLQIFVEGEKQDTKASSGEACEPKDDPPKEEPPKDDPPSDDPPKDDPPKDDPPKEEQPKDDPQSEERSKDDTARDDPLKEKTSNDNSPKEAGSPNVEQSDEEKQKEDNEKEAASPVTVTEKGGELPATSTAWYNLLLLSALAIIITSGLLWRLRRITALS